MGQTASITSNPWTTVLDQWSVDKLCRNPYQDPESRYLEKQVRSLDNLRPQLDKGPSRRDVDSRPLQAAACKSPPPSYQEAMAHIFHSSSQHPTQQRRYTPDIYPLPEEYSDAESEQFFLSFLIFFFIMLPLFLTGFVLI